MAIQYPSSSDPDNRLLAKLLQNGVGPEFYIPGESTWSVLRKLVNNQASGLAASTSDTERALIAKLLANNANAGGGGGGGGGGGTPIDDFEPETLAWYGDAIIAGGAISDASRTIANDLVVAMRASGYISKIVYLIPLLGQNLAHALTPLIDKLGKGRMANTAFVNGDFSEATGLQGNGTTKILVMPLFPGDLGSSGNGGLGHWELNFQGSSRIEPIGVYQNSAGGSRFLLDLRTTLRAFRWGGPANGASEAVSADNAHYYGQRSASNNRRVYRNGTELANNTTVDAAAGLTTNLLRAMGSFDGTSFQWDGRAGVFYCTDGTLTGPEITAMHADVAAELMTPTGRV